MSLFFERLIMRIRESAKLSLIIAAAIWPCALARVHAQKQKDEDLLNVTLITGDHTGADDVLLRYDEDKDGFLDKKEMAKLKWLSDPNRFDLNRNGRLTKLEIAIQFANLRKDFGVTLPDTYNATRMINLYDKNGDRQLNSDERRAFPWQTDLAELDVNKDKQVSVFEIAKKFAADYQQLGVEARDQWDALQYMRKYDADDDDHLDKKEVAKTTWPTDPARFDRDKDGRLTCMEIAIGIAKNKLEAGIERSDQLVAAG